MTVVGIEHLDSAHHRIEFGARRRCSQRIPLFVKSFWRSISSS
jgi:hypothetical protein